VKNPSQHNYLKHLFELHASGQLKEGSVTTLTVIHNNQCQLFKGGRCDCNPTLSNDATRSNRRQRRNKGGQA
jgi:hypothetical protein